MDVFALSVPLVSMPRRLLLLRRFLLRRFLLRRPLLGRSPLTVEANPYMEKATKVRVRRVASSFPVPFNTADETVVALGLSLCHQPLRPDHEGIAIF